MTGPRIVDLLRGVEMDRWVLNHRGKRASVDPWTPLSVFAEEEPSAGGSLDRVLVVLLVGSECPWRCVMCALWRSTFPGQMPAGAVPDQIRKALSSPTVGELSGHLTAIKLYNSGSFFDTRSVPPQDYDAIARLTARFPRVIVECHPALIGSAVLRFRELVAGRLEVAMGLETANLSVLEMLNKRLTPAGFMRAARFLTENDVDVRAFVLIQPPFVSAECAAEMAAESAEFAFQCGASVVSLIPTRSDDGVLQVLERNGYFARPSLHVIERALELSIALGKGRVIVDLWKLDEFAECQACFEARRTRLARMNLTQAAVPRVSCSTCGS